jgi:hypothetical protein
MKAAFISALLVAGSYAMPAALQKRATFTDEVVVTVWTTTTIYADATAAAFAERSSKSHSTSSSSISSSSAPVPTSTTSTTTIPAVVTPPVQVTTPAPVVAAVTTPPAAPAPAAPTPAAAAPASGGLVSGTGDLTYYDLTAGLTSCGGSYTNTQNVVALSFPDMNNGANSNNNPLCGKTITIHYNGVTATGIVVDSCAGCAQGSIDLSPTLFTTLTGGLGAGRVYGATWTVT